MTEIHITIGRLSDLHDEEVTIQEEREALLEHINDCVLCKTEFEQLRSSINFCGNLRQVMVCEPGFSKAAMNAIKWRSRRRLMMRYIPAVAASIVLVGGFALISTPVNEPIIQQSTFGSTVKQSGGIENIVSILSSHNASILKISDMFIEGEIHSSNFPKLRRELASRKMFFSIGMQQGRAHRMLSSDWNPLIEPVGSSNFSSNVEYAAKASEAGEGYIRFRVFR